MKRWSVDFFTSIPDFNTNYSKEVKTVVNSENKTSYQESFDLVENIINIQDSYSSICCIWVKWLKKEDLGISIFSFKKYYEYLMIMHYSASTINMNLVMMKKRFLYLFDMVNNEIDKRAALEYKLKLFKAPSKAAKAISNEKIFSKKEINHLISLTGKRTSLIIEFLYITACRRGELCKILLKDCEVKEEYVKITLFGKRNKIRIVFIAEELYRKISNVFSGKQYLFEKTSGYAYDGQLIWTLVSSNARKHLNRHMSPHMLRHTRLTHLYQDTGDMKAVSMFGGHSSIKTALDLYVHHGFDKSTLLGSITDQ